VLDRLRGLASGGSGAEGDEGAVGARSGPRTPGSVAWRPVAVAIALTAAAVWLVLRTVVGGPPAPVSLTPGTPIPATAVGVAPSVSMSPTSPTAPAAQLVVHVVGDVRRPGLVRLPPGSRVADAIAAAGGLVKGGSAGGLNLARPLVDGEQVLVSRDTPAGTTGGGGTAASAGPLDLNAATETDLDGLPGVGPVLAGRIVAWRQEHGRFASVDQLREVSGIGERTFARLAPLVRV
jgi:competence protein ComEA